MTKNTNPCLVALSLGLVRTSTEFWKGAYQLGHNGEAHLLFLQGRGKNGIALVKRADTPAVLGEDPGLPEGYLDSLVEMSQPVVRKAEPCSRCGGGGIYRWNGLNGKMREGVCFRCEGSGKDPKPSR